MQLSSNVVRGGTYVLGVSIVTGRRAGVYLRISDDREGTGLGVGRQDEDCTAHCDRLGWTIVDRYTDNDISAYSGKKRPAYERLLDDLKNGRIDAVVAWHPDRLHRSPKELEHFIDIIETTGASVATVTAGTYDLATPSGRMIARTLGVHARYESEHKSERIRRKHLQIAEEGRRHGGGYRQFGYLDDRTTVHPAEADLVRQAARRIFAGETVRGVCASWNAEGIPTVQGKPWTQTSLKRILTAPSIAGLREHQGVLRPAVWPAIVDERTWRRLRVLLLDPDRRKNLASRRYLLTGLLTCGRCRATMVARPRADKRRAYVCASGPGFSGCGRMGALAEPLEEAVVARLIAGVDSPRVAAAVARRNETVGDDELLDQLAADEAALEALARDHYVDRIVGKGQFLAASQELNARIDATRRRLVHLHTSAAGDEWVGQGGLLRERWPSMTLDQQRAVLRAFVDSVTIGPAVKGLNHFDRDRILRRRGGGIAWRY